jgi:hypothetical protein
MRKFMYARKIVSSIEMKRKIVTSAQNVELHDGKINQITQP